MLKHYLKAAAGDVNYINNLITNDKSMIDIPWNPNRLEYDKYYELNHEVKAGATCLVSSLLCFASLPLGLTVAALNAVYQDAVYQDQRNAYLIKHNGWTLLEFAAEQGKQDIAVLLITLGADTNNSFLKIAAESNHHTFVTLCTQLIEQQGKVLAGENLINENNHLRRLTDELAEEIERTTESLDDVKLTNLQCQVERLLDKYEKLELSMNYNTVLDEVSLPADSVPLSPHKELKLLWNSNYALYKNTVLTLFEIYEVIDSSGYHSRDVETSLSNRITLLTIKCEKYENAYKEYRLEYINLVAGSTTPQSQQQDPELQASPTPSPAQTPPPSPRQSPANNESTPIQRQSFFSEPKTTKYPHGLIDRKVPYVRGDCFFDSAIACRPDKSWNKKQLRESIKNEFLTKRNEYDGVTIITNKNGEYFADVYDGATRQLKELTFTTYEDYCNHVLVEKRSVDAIEINAFAAANKVCCIIVNQETGLSDVFQSSDVKVSDANPPIILGFENNKHYLQLNYIF